jgi:hypothetical protein
MALQKKIAPAVRTMSSALPDNLSLPQFEVWIGRRKAALDAQRDKHDAEEDLLGTEAEARAVLQALTDALRGAGVPIAPRAALEELVAVAQKALDEEAVLKELQAKVRQRQREATKRQQQADQSPG